MLCQSDLLARLQDVVAAPCDKIASGAVGLASCHAALSRCSQALVPDDRRHPASHENATIRLKTVHLIKEFVERDFNKMYLSFTCISFS